MNKTRSSVALALVLVILASALTGMGQPAPTYHEDCIDGIDNPPNSNGGQDIFSQGCAEYPYSDGNGEEFTPIQDRFSQEIEAYPSLFEYQMMYSPDPHTLESILCFSLGFGWYATSADSQDAVQFITDNMIDCSVYMP